MLTAEVKKKLIKDKELLNQLASAISRHDSSKAYLDAKEMYDKKTLCQIYLYNIDQQLNTLFTHDKEYERLQALPPPELNMSYFSPSSWKETNSLANRLLFRTLVTIPFVAASIYASALGTSAMFVTGAIPSVQFISIALATILSIPTGGIPIVTLGIIAAIYFTATYTAFYYHERRTKIAKVSNLNREVAEQYKLPEKKRQIRSLTKSLEQQMKQKTKDFQEIISTLEKNGFTEQQNDHLKLGNISRSTKTTSHEILSQKKNQRYKPKNTPPIEHTQNKKTKIKRPKYNR